MAFKSSRIKIATAGKVRNRPLSDRYLQSIDRLLQKTHPGLGAVITSGAQDRKGQGRRRTGSTRHDINEHGTGETSDFVLTLNGKQITPGQNKALYAAFIQNAAQEFPGIGHYSWGIHVGGGKPAFWGPSKTKGDADSAFRLAYQRGRAGDARPVVPTNEFQVSSYSPGGGKGQTNPQVSPPSFFDQFLQELNMAHDGNQSPQAASLIEGGDGSMMEQIGSLLTPPQQMGDASQMEKINELLRSSAQPQSDDDPWGNINDSELLSINGSAQTPPIDPGLKALGLGIGLLQGVTKAIDAFKEGAGPEEEASFIRRPGQWQGTQASHGLLSPKMVR